MNPPLFLRPGDYFFGRHQGSVTTLLGSCVSIVLWHPRWQLLAVSHYLLPNDPSARNALDTRYGEGVFQRMLADMRRHGTHPHEYRKSIFGGGSLVRIDGPPAHRVGHNNSTFAREQFSLRNWAVDHCDLNGQHYRRLRIDGASGLIECQRNSVQPLRLGMRPR
ncbi:chemotaxis protein CheD [Pseudomonas gingeri]|uniref:chemotaxis protein CheD n=1 Tax=Pseudomonas gingeri TaxID=117681 RepID=UPI0015A4C24D|nr:chemotaxis protein CheD [Pseudomonas gingeri]NWA28686.1 chemotaxis protein CheD [Pseudomonas gingeri]